MHELLAREIILAFILWLVGNSKIILKKHWLQKL